ncbi:short chain dehydrogenase [candidate division WOR-1 bacterium RIFOXYC2_FULL_37_10]|uniref:Short chain dehydrogenase n=1 Tax=candidate division WOR-1 bacterium RIFOXYB2_FULL_37_13 TaxID=1802579 RepID=A0A1F4SEG0_UNCSA|nr:MAG: short chain dehydrogenase [candidate division WOR-1 bacterium RIFOXYA2_FULL_37_7]OGC18818.1 MAG: short chain dehydrogenase [candidate division WOR-1 bacterium RIFOXYB2_FULL_37_13]OGC32521.1 MAG: short chain dehydrogenase [candidate division WOR-1 bacterium RIFOXYC2_FULL_37_10]
MEYFKNKVIIITGASSGIGKELALQLASQGALLVLASRKEELLSPITNQCHELGGKAIAIKTDVACEDQCKNLIDKTIEAFGKIDILINNAGFGIRGNLEEQKDLKLFKYLMDVNYYGAVYCTRFSLPYLKKTKGQIIGVSSILGKIATKGNTAYSSSKFAMVGFFDALRLELKEFGIDVTMIYPGMVITGFVNRMLQPDGSLIGKDGDKFYSKDMMSTQKCAQIIINAIRKRKRQVIMTWYGVLGVWLNLIAPSLLDFILQKVNANHRKKLGKNI